MTTGRVALPVGFALTAVALAAYDTVADLNPLASDARPRHAARRRPALRPDAGLADAPAHRPARARGHRPAHRPRQPPRAARAARAGARARAAATAQPVAVVALDIDHFKAINDTYGHSEGDAALQAIADVLRAQARPYDLVARIGGEEFVLVLPDVDGDTAYAIGRALPARPRRPARPRLAGVLLGRRGVLPRGRRATATACSSSPTARCTGPSAPGARRSRRFDPREVVLLSSAEQQDQVREVLATPGALTPVFQPIVELATGRVAGYEALTRFRTEPVRPPDAWFAQARRCGLGPALEARAIELCLAVPGPPRRHVPVAERQPRARCVTPEVAAVLPDDLSDIVIELTEDELFSTDDALDHELDGAAGARRADRRRRRRRRLRGPAAAHPHQARHPQARPLADRGAAPRQLEDRAARGAVALRQHHRRRGLRRGHRGGRRAADARALRRDLRAGLRARRAPAPAGRASTPRSRCRPRRTRAGACASRRRSSPTASTSRSATSPTRSPTSAPTDDIAPVVAHDRAPRPRRRVRDLDRALRPSAASRRSATTRGARSASASSSTTTRRPSASASARRAGQVVTGDPAADARRARGARAQRLPGGAARCPSSSAPRRSACSSSTAARPARGRRRRSTRPAPSRTSSARRSPRRPTPRPPERSRPPRRSARAGSACDASPNGSTREREERRVRRSTGFRVRG